jgi:hypothetical protein
MKRYFLLGCIVAITPTMQSVSANAADLFVPRVAPSYRVPPPPPPPPPCCCCGGWGGARWGGGGWYGGGWGGGGW